MPLMIGRTPKTFNLLSIGCRGAGKTVFLAGSYADLKIGSHVSPHRRFSLDCLDNVVQGNIEGLLRYVAQTGNYPPPTIKFTDFAFRVQHHKMWGSTTLCQFCWWDIPGESCTIQDPDFRRILLNSHGCCLLIDANAVVHDTAYLNTLGDLIKRVESIACLMNQNGLKYPFALILTKCDLLEANPLNLVQLQGKMQPLMARFDAVKAHYQTFYSSIPIVSDGGTARLKSAQAAQPILWLTTELKQIYRFQPPQVLASRLKQIFTNSGGKTSTVPNGLGQSLFANPTKVGLTAAISLIVVGSIFTAFLGFGQLRLASEQSTTPERQIQQYEKVLKRDPSDVDALTALVSQHTELGQYKQAIPYLEQLAQLQPQETEIRFELAGLYALTNQMDKEEAAYDQILAQDTNNLIALTSKAKLRVENGDTKAAKALFAQAEKTAPTRDLKATVREIAQDALN